MKHIKDTSMHTDRWALAACCMASLMPVAAAVATEGPEHCAAPSDLRLLSGRWQAQALVHVSTGVASSQQELQLEVGANGEIRGQRSWEARNTNPGAIRGRDRLGNPTFRDVQPMIGWIQPRTCRIVLVELEDRGQARGWLRRDASGPVLDLEISQSGNGAVVLFATFQRTMNQPSSTTPDR
jgi:hypothetical protein